MLPYFGTCFGNAMEQDSMFYRDTVVAKTQNVEEKPLLDRAVPGDPLIPGKDSPVKTFNKVPLAAVKIKDIDEILNNQNLLNLFGLDNDSANFFLLAMLPMVGKNCSALKKGANVALFFFENFLCIVAQISEENKTLKNFLTKEKMPFEEGSAYEIFTEKKENFDLVTGDKDLLKSLLEFTKQPIDSGQIEFTIKNSGILELAKGKHDSFFQSLIGKDLKDSVKEIKIGIQIRSTGMDIYAAAIFDKIFSFCSKLKGENYKKPSIGEYIEAKDAAMVMFLQNLSWMLDALDPFAVKIIEQCNRSESVFFKKIWDILRKIPSPNEALLCLAHSFQGEHIVSFGHKISGQLTFEQYIESYVLGMDNFQKFLNEILSIANPLALDANKDKEIFKFNCQYHPLCEYKEYKIYEFSDRPEIDPHFMETLVPKKSEAFFIRPKETWYAAFVNGQVLGSDSVDNLKAMIDNAVAKKLPTVDVESFVGGIGEGTVAKFEAELVKIIDFVLSKITEPEFKEMKDAITSTLAKKSGNIGASLEAKDDRLQFNLSLDYSFIGLLLEIQEALEKLFSQMKYFQQQLPEAAKKAEPAKAVDEKEPVLTKTAYISKFENIVWDDERQILIPVKIVAEYKVFC
jgi:hypothetical protein